MGDIFSKWEILTLVEMKSVVQKRFLVFFFLVPHVERAAPQAYDCHTSSTFFGDWIQRTFFSFLLPKPTIWLGGGEGSRLCSRTSPKLATLTMGHPTGPPNPAWLGACPHCLPDDHLHMEGRSAAPHPHAWTPTGLSKEAWSIFPTGRLRFLNIFWWGIWPADASNSSLSWRHQYIALCDRIVMWEIREEGSVLSNQTHRAPQNKMPAEQSCWPHARKITSSHWWPLGHLLTLHRCFTSKVPPACLHRDPQRTEQLKCCLLLPERIWDDLPCKAHR